MNAKSLGPVLLGFLLGASLLAGGSLASAGALPEHCRQAPVAADCTASLFDHLLERIAAERPYDQPDLKAALADKLINLGSLDLAQEVAVGIDHAPTRDVKLAVIGVLQANQRHYAEASAIADLIGDPQQRLPVYTAIVERFVADGDVEPAWTLAKALDDAALSDSFQAALVVRFAAEGRFELTLPNALEVRDAGRRADVLFGLASRQLASQPLADVLQSLEAIDDPEVRARDFALLGQQAHDLKKPDAAETLFARALEGLAQAEAAGSEDTDDLRQSIARALEAAGRATEALAVAAEIRDVQRRLESAGRIAPTLAQSGQTDAALSMLKNNVAAAANTANSEQRTLALTRQAEFMVEAGFADEAFQVIARIEAPDRRSDARQALARTAARQNAFDLAERIVAEDPSILHRVTGQLGLAMTLSIVEGERARALALAEEAQMALEMDAIAGAESVYGMLVDTQLNLRQFDRARSLIDWLQEPEARFDTLDRLAAAAARAGAREALLRAIDDMIVLVAGDSFYERYGRTAMIAKRLPWDLTPKEILLLSKRLKQADFEWLFVNVAAVRLAEGGRLDVAQELVALADDPDLTADFELPELAALLELSIAAE
ncbi:hypothetical protein [Pelagibius sp.]|uniref:hypothetical protein n=1 Tax=Pelagibius sp. TaxID=1931238 RepID=UPI0026195018|nr:hypothetical protein [Pelagibius sp.]